MKKEYAQLKSSYMQENIIKPRNQLKEFETCSNNGNKKKQKKRKIFEPHSALGAKAPSSSGKEAVMLHVGELNCLSLGTCAFGRQRGIPDACATACGPGGVIDHASVDAHNSRLKRRKMNSWPLAEHLLARFDIIRSYAEVRLV